MRALYNSNSDAIHYSHMVTHNFFEYISVSDIQTFSFVLCFYESCSFRLYIQAMLYSMCLSLSDLFHLA